MSPPEQSHLVVCLPEIVSHILSYVHESDTKKPYAVLYPSLLVNQLWHDCASRLLWRELTFDDDQKDYNAFLNIVASFSNTLSDPPPLFHGTSTTPGTPPTPGTPGTPAMSGIPAPQIASPFLAVPTQGPSYFDKLTFSHIIRTHSTHPTDRSRIELYSRSVRSLTLRKLKSKQIDIPLQQLSLHTHYLKRLDFYICDHISDASFYPFITHHLTHISLAGCHCITDEAIAQAARQCPQLEHLDLRACGQVSDVSVKQVARHCPRLKHLNVGRVRDRERITGDSIIDIAKYTQVSVLGLAGCDVDDTCMIQLAYHRREGLERISVNNCPRITNQALRAYVTFCPHLSVFEMKECHCINDWESVATLVERKVLLTLCDKQNRACGEWARRKVS
ncbi:hypothetical protein BDF14DRAFT_1721765 [Spinellus fusiger]|nr:hypothetical protein BDF14DRAFT_1721765 [Spinellus fusiger]